MTEPLPSDDITIKKFPRFRLYYYQGNFFYPIELKGSESGEIKGFINRWLKDPENRKRIERDRKHSEYRTPAELSMLSPES